MTADGRPRQKPPAWAHFLAGATGGMTATVVTSPLDIVKTRLQSTLSATAVHHRARAPSPQPRGMMAYVRDAGRPARDTMAVLGAIRRNEGALALFRGLGPNLAGYVPATAIKFALYGNAKPALAALTGGENAWTHLSAGILAGVLTCTATNPFWVIKTRLQLDRAWSPAGGTGARRYRNSLDCVTKTLRDEGVRGLYKGLSASYIGTLETALQWVLYERLKSQLALGEGHAGGVTQSVGEALSAGSAKLVAAIALYPHEVLRTRLREAPMAGASQTKITLLQCLRTIIAKEGAKALYGGLTAHLLRVVPSSAIVFSVYEATLRLFTPPAVSLP